MSPNENRQELARDRTDWAWQRNLLAEQRNFSAWIRTGLAAMGVGFAVVKLLGETEPPWMIHAIGGALVGAGLLIHLLAFASYCRACVRLRRQGLPGLPIWSLSLVMAALSFSALAMLLLILTEAGLLHLDGFGLRP